MAANEAKDEKKDEEKQTQPKITSKPTPIPTIPASRPCVTVFTLNGKPTKKLLRIPDVMRAPIRADIVNFVHTNMAKNNRQPYAVQNREGPKGIRAGHQVAAASWGTGRAVSRVPRVKGGGTHRAGQGAYANMCRGGRMFAPTKIWRRWHRKINTDQKRYAVCSAIAASAVPALVMARGHRIQTTHEIPIVIERSSQYLQKTKAAMELLKNLGLSDELKRTKKRYKRAGRGKSRNRRWRHRLGPLIVYRKNNGLVEAARNIRGVDFCNVYQLNLLKLAPGGHVGRLVIWTEDAFRALNDIYGTSKKDSLLKNNYHMPRSLMTNSDLNRIINSQEIQSFLQPKKRRKRVLKKRNPLKRPELYAKLNPLFDEQWQEIKKNYRPDAKPRTTRILKPLKKRQRVYIELSKDEKKQMQGYWNTVFGEDKIFKTREQLAAEKVAVKQAQEAIEREKKGLDIMEALGVGADDSNDKPKKMDVDESESED